MRATEFERNAGIDQLAAMQTRGYIAMTFRWTNFTATEGDTLIVGDVFRGGWAINDGQWLQIRASDNLTILESPAPPPDSGSVAEGSFSWVGEKSFAPEGRPRLELAPEGETGGSSDLDGAGTDDGGDRTVDDADNSGVGLVGVGILVVLVLSIGIGVAWYFGVIRRDDGDPAASTPAESHPEADTESPAVTPEETISDEDRVLNLLEENGGRMKQVTIVDETDWSKSKVSMLLSDMEEEDLISKLRVGRENIISLAGEEPDAAGSPFDEE
jgi:hypothetical protein